MKIKIEETCIIGKFNLINDSIPRSNEDRYIRQLNIEEVKVLGKSILNLIK